VLQYDTVTNTVARVIGIDNTGLAGLVNTSSQCGIDRITGHSAALEGARTRNGNTAYGLENIDSLVSRIN
jgi:hypothetical protein